MQSTSCLRPVSILLSSWLLLKSFGECYGADSLRYEDTAARPLRQKPEFGPLFLLEPSR